MTDLFSSYFTAITGAVLFAAGFLLAFLISHFRAKAQYGEKLSRVESRLVEAETKQSLVESEKGRFAEEVGTLRSGLEIEKQARTVAETRLEEERRNLEQQKQQFEAARKQLEDSFAALSNNALDQNSRMFEERAKKTMELYLEQAKGDLGKRHEAIGGLVKPLSDELDRYRKQLMELEKDRSQAYGSLEKHLLSLGQAQETLQRETSSLVVALRGHKTRGRWGELTLRRVVELAGMNQHCDFSQQTTVDVGDTKQRPDLVVKLPGGRVIVVDAKAPMAAYLDAVEAVDEKARTDAFNLHARNVRDHLKQLSMKAYWNQFDQTPELVVMFIPGESFFSAALEADPGLIEYGAQNRVVVATPTTLISLLRAVEYGWRQEKMAENAKEISQIGQELHGRLRVFAGHMATLGKSLDKSVDSFNKAVGSMERNVLPSARRFKNLGAGDGEEIPLAKSSERQTRRISSPELLEED